MSKKSLRTTTCLLAAVVAIAAPLTFAAGKTPLRAVAAAATPDPDARVDRLIVRYRPGAIERSNQQRLVGAVQSALNRSGIAAAGSASVQYVRKTATGADVVKLSRKLDRASAGALMRTLAADPSVAHVEPDLRAFHADQPVRAKTAVSPMLTPDDEYFAQYQWHLHHPTGGINATSAWDASTGEGVVVAVLDTGVVDHEDLNGNVLEGYDFITDPFVSRRETADRVPGAHDYGDWNDDGSQCPIRPSSFHGTHVSGTVAEMTNNGIGMAGVAHQAKVLPVRVLGRCGGYTSDIADAIVWASGGEVEGVPANENPAEVINLSLGGNGACTAGSEYQLAIDQAIANGTTVVVAAGNSNVNMSNFSPASCAGVIAVGATRVTGGKADYSNFGAGVDLSAPGGGGAVDGNPNGYVWQNINDSETAPEEGTQTYMGMTGTSMAAPHVAGVAALVQSAAETPLTPAEMETLLKNTARPFPVSIPGSTPLGVGIVDAEAALGGIVPPCEGDDCTPDATPIVNRSPVTGLMGDKDAELLFSLDVPAGASGLSFMTYGGSGDVTMLVSFAAEPTADDYDLRSTRPGNNERINIAAPKAGTYYIKLVGVAKFAKVTLEARHN
ncbi:S8 family serine peptidase [Luteimonas sp. SX5]|uniref:S8 family serine peptidase n=1 Tax=Luteimonas galliterrae TaxID=2940486 RepID=A0ABT0MLB2_9GAMM|nr:S8 family peptidase [Luteimonas galliterrae]MCL1635661.1 S8 family serine peptidase [Luteimonas galliterrae]